MLKGRHLVIEQLGFAVSFSIVRVPARAPIGVKTRGTRSISSKEIRLHADEDPAHAVVTSGEVLPRRRLRVRRRATGQGEVLVASLSPRSTRRSRTWRRTRPHLSACLAAASLALSSLLPFSSTFYRPRPPHVAGGESHRVPRLGHVQAGLGPQSIPEGVDRDLASEDLRHAA